MTTDHTAIDLLGAVGVDWEQTPELCGTLIHGGLAYTGPGQGTPELDALLLVAGQRWLREQFAKPGDLEFVVMSKIDRTSCNGWMALLVHDTPGHALARAIREVTHA